MTVDEIRNIIRPLDVEARHSKKSGWIVRCLLKRPTYTEIASYVVGRGATEQEAWADAYQAFKELG